MSRKARAKSASGIYHVMLRGINQQQIFEEDDDYNKLIQIIAEYKETSEFELYAYCLMSNHIHLLIKERKEPLQQVIKRIGTKFVYWYNTKYQRAGHLFQDRYKSEAVEDWRYLKTVLVYIHRNPLKSGICKNIIDYKYSSYSEYLTETKIVDTELIMENWDIEQFKEAHRKDVVEKCLDVEEEHKIRLTDEQASEILKKIAKCKNTTEFQALEIKQRDKYIIKLKQKGLSIRQISRLTGTPKGIVERLVRA